MGLARGDTAAHQRPNGVRRAEDGRGPQAAWGAKEQRRRGIQPVAMFPRYKSFAGKNCSPPPARAHVKDIPSWGERLRVGRRRRACVDRALPTGRVRRRGRGDSSLCECARWRFAADYPDRQTDTRKCRKSDTAALTLLRAPHYVAYDRSAPRSGLS